MPAPTSPTELIEFIARALVSEPEAVRASERKGERLIELETAQADRGRVIGRQGRVAKAMRVLLACSREGTNHRLDIVD